MVEGDPHSVVYSANVIEFVTVANVYCSVIEDIRLTPVREGLLKLQKILPLLYLKAALISKPESILDEALEKYVTEVEYHFLQQQWLEALGEHDLFPELFDPEIQFGTERVTASISEHLLDIYQDIKDFLMLYRLGNEPVMNDALHECIDHFEIYWGQRLVNVLRPIHKLITDNSELSQAGTLEDLLRPKSSKDPSSPLPENFWRSSEDEDLKTDV